MSAPPRYSLAAYVAQPRTMIDLAMVYGSQAVEWSREYAWYSSEARNVTGRRRCQYAALAGAAKRKARTYTALHNAALRAVRA